MKMAERIKKPTLSTVFPASDAVEATATPTESELANHLLKHRQSLSVGCWNVCSLKCPATRTFIAGKCERYCMDIMCVSETRLNGNLEDEPVSAPGGKSEFHFFNSGPSDGSGNARVGLSSKISS